MENIVAINQANLNQAKIAGQGMNKISSISVAHPECLQVQYRK